VPTALSLPGGLDTPALVVFVGVVEANARRLQDQLDRRGVALRPHAKTHKSVRIGRLQVEAGARGLTVGTLGEAEVFAAAGFDDLLVAYPILADGPKAARLRALHDALPGLRVGVDSAEGARRLAAAARGAGGGRRLRVVVEVDPGNRRTGVATPDVAAEVACAARDAGLVVDGVFAHGGHSYRPGGAEAAAADEVRALAAAAAALETEGFEVATVSAGSTPTMTLAATGRVTEIRAGTYVLGDHQQVVLGAVAPDACAAVVAATVVSVQPDRFVVDAGAKSLTKDRPDWLPGFGHLPAYPNAVVDRLSDYHGVVVTPPGAERPALGEVVAIVPNHVCPVVDLFDAFTAVLPDGSIERWPVDARGRSG
jgi:D-serine deaminase-like pyridoxal phosphate-dependent protein